MNLIKTKRPKMTNHRGRTWDYCEVIFNGKSVRGYLDTTWGEYVYMVTEDDSWYKFRHSDAEDISKVWNDSNVFKVDDKRDLKFKDFKTE